MSLKGTQVSSSPKQASALASSPAKPLLPGAPASSSRLMRNSSSLRGRGGDATFPGLACLVGLGPDTLPGGSLGVKVCCHPLSEDFKQGSQWLLPYATV